MTTDQLNSIVRDVTLDGNYVNLTVHKQFLRNCAVFMHFATPGQVDGIPPYSETLQALILVNDALDEGERKQQEELLANAETSPEVESTDDSADAPAQVEVTTPTESDGVTEVDFEAKEEVNS